VKERNHLIEIIGALVIDNRDATEIVAIVSRSRADLFVVAEQMRRLVASAAAATVRGSLPSGRTMCCGLDAARCRIRSRMSMDDNVATDYTDQHRYV
jgi:hypothetical protein